MYINSLVLLLTFHILCFKYCLLYEHIKNFQRSYFQIHTSVTAIIRTIKGNITVDCWCNCSSYNWQGFRVHYWWCCVVHGWLVTVLWYWDDTTPDMLTPSHHCHQHLLISNCCCCNSSPPLYHSSCVSIDSHLKIVSCLTHPSNIPVSRSRSPWVSVIRYSGL